MRRLLFKLSVGYARHGGRLTGYVTAVFLLLCVGASPKTYYQSKQKCNFRFDFPHVFASLFMHISRLFAHFEGRINVLFVRRYDKQRINSAKVMSQLPERRKVKNTETLRHVRYKEKTGGNLPIPAFIEMQVIGTGAPGSPKSFMINAGNAR